MKVGDEKIEFNFHDAMKYPYINVYSITYYQCVQQVCDFDSEAGLSVALSYDYDFTKIEEMERHICVPQNVHESVEITSLETNKVLKINGHCLKPFYDGWTTELTAFVELAKPIYEE